MYADSHIQELDSSNSCYWLQVWRDSDKEEVDDTKITDNLGKLKKKLHIFLQYEKVFENFM